MKVLVTGCAGFIGSHLSERLCQDGHQVIGVDSFSDYYSEKRKERHLQKLKAFQNFKIIKNHLLKLNLDDLLIDFDVIYHQAAQAGVRASWGKYFKTYVDDNILSTQKLLETLLDRKPKKIVFASSSSVYGNIDDLPMREESSLNPVSPYGVTKLASEKLCSLYWENYNLPVISLRYFTVYGPRQRPDMAFSKFIKAALEDSEITIYGDGLQTRDFTYIDDIVEANIAAAGIEENGLVFNLGGGSRSSINEVLKIISKLSKKELKVKYDNKQPGDVKHTWADTEKAKQLLGFNPQIDLEDGLKRQYLWAKDNLDVL